MKKLSCLLILLLVLTVVFVACETTPEDKPPVVEKTVTETKVVLYDGPKVMTSSEEVSVKVEDKDVFVYDTRVNHARSFTYTYSKDTNPVAIFDFEGKVHVEIEVKGATAVSDVVVRPLSREVKATASGNKISFDLSYTDNYVVEYATSQKSVASKNAIHLFANPIETDPITADNIPAKTVYVGPGVWMANALPVVEDGTTVYIAGGAVIYGQIRTANVKNITIRGRGILAGQLFDRTKASEFTLPIELQSCKDVTIKDITILDPAGWAVTLYKCEDVNVENLKIITARANGDGISVQSCKNVNVKGGFVRTWDDSLVVKNVDNTDTENITFDGVYVWTDLAQSMEVGYETYGPKMNGITFKNITVFHNFHKAAMSIHNADNATITNVTYENITIEDAQMLGDNQLDGDNDFLIDITIAYNTEWTQSGGARGKISDITFSNIKVLQMAETIVCRIYGEGSGSNVDKVTVSDVEIAGKKMTSLKDLQLEPGVFTSNISYKNSKQNVTGAANPIPYNLELKEGDKALVTVKENIMQQGLQVPSFAILNNEPSYAGVKIASEKINITATLGAGDRAGSPWDTTAVQDTETNKVGSLIDGDRSTEWVFDGWTGEENEFVALSFYFENPTQVGNIRIMGSTASDIMRYYTVSMFYKATADGNWSRFQVASEIALSPQSSNYVDFLIARPAMYGLQLRFFANDTLTHPKTIAIGEIEFYPPSFTTGKAVNASEYEDVYDSGKVNDGNPLTYFESKKGLFPAFIEVDMGQSYTCKYINIHLPPLLLWEERTQEIEIQGSIDGQAYFTVVAKTTYTFDPTTGNLVAIVLDTPVEMRYIKLVYSSNSTGYGAQISELFVYGA